MDLVTALAISIGLLGGLATWLFFGPLAGMGIGLTLWAAFIAWGSFYHCGGKTSGLQNSVLSNIWGAIIGGLTMYALGATGNGGSLGLPLGAAICVAIGVFVLVMGSKIPLFPSIPAAVYGFAATVALALATNAGVNAYFAPSLANPIINISLSMIVGGLFGYVSEQLAGMLAKR